MYKELFQLLIHSTAPAEIRKQHALKSWNVMYLQMLGGLVYYSFGLKS